MSIASRISAIEEHLTDDYSVLELAGADLTNVDKNIINLKPTWKERLLYFMNNGTDVVWNNWDKVVGEGESLSLNNTLEARMKIELKGNTYQYSTSGKNLLNVDETFPQTNGGLTISRESDGKITISGTATSTPSFYLTTQQNITLQPGTYTLSEPNNFRVFLIPGYKGRTFTLTEETTFTRAYIAVQSENVGQTYNESFYPMLVSGSTLGDYEPYTNGASPNPDYPQDIQVVSGDNTIKVEGKNLLKIEDREGTSAGITYTIKDGIITFNGTATGSGALYIYIDKTFDRNETFSLVKEGTATGINNPMQWVRDGTTRYTYNSLFKSGDRLMQLYFTWVSGATANNYVVKPMLEVGSTATTYEPYVSQTYPISLGDIELCKIGDYQDKIYKDKDNGKWYLNKQIGKVVLDGSEEWNYADNIFYLSYSLQKYVGTAITTTSNYFKGGLNKQTRATFYSSNDNYTIGFSPSMFFIRDDSITSANNFETWLSTHNTEVYYVLATPTYETITDTTLLSQLNALGNANSYNNQTNINQDNNDLASILNATALEEM